MLLVLRWVRVFVFTRGAKTGRCLTLTTGVEVGLGRGVEAVKANAQAVTQPKASFGVVEGIVTARAYVGLNQFDIIVTTVFLGLTVSEATESGHSFFILEYFLN